jgi:hypothetical protein
MTRWRRWITIIVLLPALSLLVSCDLKKFQYSYNGLIPATPLGTQVATGFRFNKAATNLAAGRIKIKGKIIPVAVGASPQTLPNQVQFLVVHADSKGHTLESFNFDVNLKSDGSIPIQSFAFNGIQINNKQRVSIFLLPLDGNLPFSTLKLSVKYVEGA